MNRLTQLRWLLRGGAGRNFQGGWCWRHSLLGYTCGCDEIRDCRRGVHRPSQTGNMFGGYKCVCGGDWMDSYGTCTGPEEVP